MQINTGIRQPCQGIRDAYHSTVQPLTMCQDCRRWLDTRDIPAITPRVEFASLARLLMCFDRVPSAVDKIK